MAGSLAETDFLTSAPLWLAVALLLGGGVLLAWPIIRRQVLARRSAAMTRRVPTVEDRFRTVRAAAAQRDELERLVAEARETIRIGCAQLDARLEKLERLTGDTRTTETELRNDAAAHVHVRPVHPAAASTRTAEPIDPLTRQVYSLADEGRSALEIASQLDEHTGKIELMLAIRRA
ncbi:MAG: hypothetical protein JNK58_01900 [Phycisphaerae bacterium]|nr:hypothetical protein [Phycisphaerae bacterium]